MGGRPPPCCRPRSIAAWAGGLRCRSIGKGDGLVPFTDLCAPVPVKARQCECGSWVTQGDATCGFCCDPASGGAPTLLWRPANPFFVPLAPVHLNLPGPVDGDDIEGEDENA